MAPSPESGLCLLGRLSHILHIESLSRSTKAKFFAVAVFDPTLRIPIMKKLLAVLVLAATASATATAGAADIVGNAKAARTKVEQCIGCHGIPDYKSGYPEVYRVPMIGGQSPKYIEAARHADHKGDRQ